MSIFETFEKNDIGSFKISKLISCDSIISGLPCQSWSEARNLNGSPSKWVKTRKTISILLVFMFPTRIISLNFKPKSKNILELYLDNWRSLKFTKVHHE